MAGPSSPSLDSPESPHRLSRAGLPLPDPYPDYIACPHCGEPEVEVWCYQKRARCHQCGHWLPHTPATCRGTSAVCRPLAEAEDRAASEPGAAHGPA